MDNLGFGCTQKYDKQWVAHQDSFNDLLAGLSAETATTAADTGKGLKLNYLILII